MANYKHVPQADDAEAASNASDEPDSPAPAIKKSPTFETLSLDFDNLGGGQSMNSAKIDDSVHKPSSSGGVLSLRSGVGRSQATSASYDLVEEDDDYGFIAVDQQGETANDRRLPQRKQSARSASSNKLARHAAVGDDPPLQSPRSSRPVPLAHPTPDLQSGQGRYLGNVERLEKSAESFDMHSGDNGHSGPPEPPENSASPGRSRRLSAASGGSSRSKGDAMRSNVYSPTGGFPSPRQSALSSPGSHPESRRRSGSIASRLTGAMVPVNEEQDMQSFPQNTVSPMIPPPDAPTDQFSPHMPSPHHQTAGHAPPEDVPGYRPPSAGSTDTYRQATDLFKDFDGVHFVPHRQNSDTSRSISLSRPPLARESQPHKEPDPDQDMIYYPAPVPMILNLPQRLGKRSALPEAEKRRTQAIETLAPEYRKSTALLPDAIQEETTTPRESKRLTQLPPQLRASAFFDGSQTHLDVQVREQSAVATLDSILDAAAHAPVRAFTDHPIVGEVGAGIYENSKLKKKKHKEDKQKRKSLAATSVAPTLNPTQRVSQDLDRYEESQAGYREDEALQSRTSYHQDRHTPQPVDSGRQSVVDRRSHDYEREESDSESDEDDDDDGSDQEPVEADPSAAPTTLLAELQKRKAEQKQRTRNAATAFPNGMHTTLLELDAVAQRQQKTRNQKHVTLAWEDPDMADRRDADDEEVPLAVLFPEKNKAAEENGPVGLMGQLKLDENEPLSHRRARMRGEPIGGGRGPSPGRRDSAAYTLDLPAPGANQSDEEEEETLAQRLKRLRAREAGGAEDSATDNFASDILSQFQVEAPKQPDAAPEEEETLGQRRKRLQTEAAQQTQSLKPGSIAPRHSMASLLQAHPAVPQGAPSLAYPGNRLSMATMQAPPTAPPRHATNSNIPYNTPYAQPNATPYGNRMTLAPGQAPGEQPPTIDPQQRAMIDRWRLSVR